MERIRKLITSLLASPFVSEFIIQYSPYFPYIKSVTYLVVGDVITGILANSFEKYKTIHPATLLKTFKSFKLLRKLGIGILFFVGLHYIHTSDILLQKLGVSENEAGIWWCVAYGIYEITSILENLGRLNFPVAKQVKNWINSKVPEEMKDKEKDDDNTKQS